MSEPEWIDDLAKNESRREQVATDMLLAAVRSAADCENYRLLRHLVAGGGAGVDELASTSGLPRLAVVERVGAMTQAGLVQREIESGQVCPTALATGLVGLLERVRSGFVRRIEEGLTRLLREGR